VCFPNKTQSYSNFSKENGGLKFVISKPPLGYCILFWRADNQPPQQRFFLFTVGR